MEHGPDWAILGLAIIAFLAVYLFGRKEIRFQLKIVRGYEIETLSKGRKWLRRLRRPIAARSPNPLPQTRALRNIKATHIVSLGNVCRVAYNLRRHYDFRSAYPFDWWITPLPALLKFLRDPDLGKLYDPKFLAPERDERGKITAVKNTHYNISLHHEFPRDKFGFVVEDFLAHLEAPRARTAKLLRKLTALRDSGNTILAARAGSANWQPNTKEMNAFLDTVFGFFAPARVRLLLINMPQPDRENVTAIQFPDPSGPRIDWKGDSDEWSRQLGALGVEFLNVEGSHYEEPKLVEIIHRDE